MASVEKTYADAFFSLLEEENAPQSEFDAVLSQFNDVQSIIGDVPDFIKLLDTPTVSDAEKLSLIGDVFSGKASPEVYNFLRLLAVNRRMDWFVQISRAFKLLYNQKFDIAEITVTSAMPLSDDLREKIVAKMTKITGKTVAIIEKVEKSLIGGVMIDYGNTRYDGTVKTRLSELKKDISGIIA
jgi:F-type H+-transporting ATPase subunit delta